MKAKTIFQVAMLVLLVGGAIYYVMGLFTPPDIQILCDIHPPRIFRNNNAPRAAQAAEQYNVAFGFDDKCELTRVEVVPLDEWTTNKEALRLWNLVSESNSIPVKAVIYGQWIRGMHPFVKGARPQPLDTNVTYRLMIAAGSRKGECDFKLPALPQTMAR